MIWSKRGARERPLSPHTRQKSGCFFSLISITKGACVAIGACWVMSALGGVRVSPMCLCDRDCVHLRLVLAAMFPWVMLTHLGTLQEGGGVRRGKEREMAKRCQRRGEQSRARWDELLPRAQPSLQAHFWVGLSDKSGTSAWFACRKGNWKEFVLVHLHDYGFKMTIAIMCHHCSLIFRDRLFFFYCTVT